ncbi:MAG: hypothetical protein KJ051_12905 [Thermoleophilia bacterium]|nr:hypothetical protein [Thermoleophilia bacterium]
MNLDFSDATLRARLLAAQTLITDGYRILRDEVGADNPADNAFLREATICAHQHLIWVGDRGGTDARSPNGEEVEIKSTRLDGRPSIQFPTSRYVSPTVIERFRAADWFAFGVFDLYESMVALYRVDQVAMNPLISGLEETMRLRLSQGRPLQNNPKFPFARIRPIARRLYFDDVNYLEETVGIPRIVPR